MHKHGELKVVWGGGSFILQSANRGQTKCLSFRLMTSHLFDSNSKHRLRVEAVVLTRVWSPHQVEVLPLLGPDQRSCVSLNRSWGGGGGARRRRRGEAPLLSATQLQSKRTWEQQPRPVLSWKSSRKTSTNSNFLVPNAET